MTTRLAHAATALLAALAALVVFAAPHALARDGSAGAAKPGAAEPGAAQPGPPAAGVAADRIPGLARVSLPEIERLTVERCPELPPVWVVAQVQAESGWDPGLRTGRAAGLYQLSERTWVAAGGRPWPDPDLTEPAAHLRIAVPWMCATLRAVAGHLATTPKPVSVLDAMLVCHIAGCRRVTGSGSGVPGAGEADCTAACSAAIERYIAAVHANLARYSADGRRPGTSRRDRVPAPPTAERAAAPAAPRAAPSRAAPSRAAPSPAAPALAAPAPAWTGGRTGCVPPDPTRAGGCLTGAARHGLRAAERAFGGLDGGPLVKKVGCWDEHAWNPGSDHPKGRACDLFPGEAGAFPDGDALDNGWTIARWFEANHAALDVAYVIWQGRYWDPSVRGDGPGWGRRYSGAGVYDTTDPTGGHYDHVHVSFAG